MHSTHSGCSAAFMPEALQSFSFFLFFFSHALYPLLVWAQGMGQSVLTDIRMELLLPYGEIRPERDPPRVRLCCPTSSQSSAQLTGSLGNPKTHTLSQYKPTPLREWRLMGPSVLVTECRPSPGAHPYQLTGLRNPKP